MPNYGKFRTRILAQEEKKRNAPVDAKITKDIKPMAKRNMGVSFTPKTGPNAGEPVAFRMPPFPRNIPRGDAGAGLRALKAEAPEAVEKMGFTRYMESEDGMLKREELKPLNKMGTVPLQRNEMPMAYKHKAYKSTGSAKAIPFTAK